MDLAIEIRVFHNMKYVLHRMLYVHIIIIIFSMHIGVEYSRLRNGTICMCIIHICTAKRIDKIK
jgi:ABC-type transport system involved in cytochrome c biogenesis permease component